MLDTGVFFRASALKRLADMDVPVVVPATVYMERGRQLRRHGVSEADWHRTLVNHGFTVEAFDRPQALAFALRIEDDKLWRRMYRDAMIAGHVGPDDVLWTTNPKDFVALGLDADRVVGV